MELERIRRGDIILCNTNSQNQVTKGIALKTANLFLNIEKYGRIFTEKFPKVCKYTTKTLTKQITTFPIYSLLHPLNIGGYTKVASLSMENGINRVNNVVNINYAIKIIGIMREEQLTGNYANNVMLKKSLMNAEFELQMVGNAKIIEKRQKVYNPSNKPV